MKMKTIFCMVFSLLLGIGVGLAQGQTKTVTGVVTDDNGIPIPGVNITIEGTQLGTSTDFDGKYSLEVAEGQVLHFNFVGFQEQMITVGAKNTLNVTLVQGQSLNEVVVTALGIEKIPDAVTSSQEIVSGEELNQASDPNAVEALLGKVSGLKITKTNSSVDDSFTIQLRGFRTITGNNEALIVIDNVISSSATLQSLPPDAIASVNVIKGAQGAALYGADGVNGVIMVTTIKGSKHGLEVTYKGTIDAETVAYLPLRQTRYGQGWDHTRDQFENGAWGPEFDGQQTMYGYPMFDYNGNGFIDMDGLGWGANPTLDSGDNPAAFQGPYEARKDEVHNFFKTGITYNNNVTVNAGDQDNYVLMNVGNTSREFIVEGDKIQKTSFLLKAGTKVGKFSFGGSINYQRVDQTSTSSGLYWDLLQSGPDIPITWYKQYPDNAYAWNAYYLNPYWYIKHDRGKSQVDRFNLGANLAYEINDHISISYNGSLRKGISSSRGHQDAFDASIYELAVSSDIASSLSVSDSDSWIYYGDLMVNFDYDLTDDIHMNLNVGHNYQENRSRSASNGGSNLAVPGVYNMHNVTLPYPVASVGDSHYRSNKHSIFGNLDLAYKDYLFLNATARNEWASVLASGNNSYFYPSVGVSFVPTKAFEGFGGDWMNYAKISANWTRVGNSSAIGTYGINQTLVLASGYPFGGANSYRDNRAPTDPNIKPEFVTSEELNLDLGFFNDRVRLGASIYQYETKDMITSTEVSRTSGFNSQLVNIGKMRSRGAEIDLGLTPIRTQDFRWDLDVSFSHNESKVLKVTDFSDERAIITDGSVGSVVAQKGSIFPLVKISKFERDPEGRIIINPDNGNPMVTSSLQNAASGVPRNIYNFSTNFSYKGFRLGVVADMRLGSKFIADIQNGLAFNGTLKPSGDLDRSQGGFIMPNSVIPDGNGGYVENTSVKTGGDDYAGVITYFSSIYSTIGENMLVDGDFFKIREITLSYTLPFDIVDKMGLRQLTLGVHARNPFTHLASNNLNYADPETSYGGTIGGIATSTQYPPTRVWGGSLTVKF